MKDNIQIGLFFDKKSIYDAVKLAELLKNKITELKEVTILETGDEKTPVLVFNKSEKIKLLCFYTHIMVNCVEEYEYEELLKLLCNFLKKSKIKISRMGYVVEKIFGQQEINLFKNNIFDSDEVINSQEFNVSWFVEDKIDNIIINCWKRYITDKNNFIVSIDINTKISEMLDIDYVFIKKFIKSSLDYISKHQTIRLI